MRFSTLLSLYLAIASVSAAPITSLPPTPPGTEIAEAMNVLRLITTELESMEVGSGKRDIPNEVNNIIDKREPILGGLLGASSTALGTHPWTLLTPAI